MASEVDICNAALNKIGARPITDLADPTSEAGVCNANYGRLLIVELQSRPWAFSTRRRNVGPSAAAPAFGPTLAFDLPEDYLSLVEVAERWAWQMQPSDSNDAAWYFEGRQILTDIANPLPLRYVAQDPVMVNYLFNEALACSLAFEICDSLTGQPAKKDRALRDYQLALERAVSSNAILQAPRRNIEGSWISSRRWA